MRKTGAVVLMALGISLFWTANAEEPEKDRLPRLRDATLLVGYPPYTLFVTSGQATRVLDEANPTGATVSPSISADGKVIASARLIPGTPRSTRPRLQVSTYSRIEQKWTDRNGLEVSYGSVAISPDASKLACITEDTPKAVNVHQRLRIRDLTSGEIREIPKTPEAFGPIISWSPDSHRVVFSRTFFVAGVKAAIYVFNTETRQVSRVVDGLSPSWAPSGEWIAYITSAGNNDFRVNVIRPDGTDMRAIRTFHSDVVPNLKPVWSPDSKLLLLNESRDPDRDTWNIYILDIVSRKVTQEFKNVAPVFGWVAN